MDDGLENMIVSGAQYGGPMAVVRDRKQFVRITGAAKPVITIYNGVGNVISKILVSILTTTYTTLQLSLMGVSRNYGSSIAIKLTYLLHFSILEK